MRFLGDGLRDTKFYDFLVKRYKNPCLLMRNGLIFGYVDERAGNKVGALLL